MQCNRCRSQISATSRTIFDSYKLPLTIWFLSIYLTTQSQISVPTLSLKKTVGVSYTTVLLIKHKVQQVMKERDEPKPISANRSMTPIGAEQLEKHFLLPHFQLTKMIIQFKCLLAKIHLLRRRLLLIGHPGISVTIVMLSPTVSSVLKALVIPALHTKSWLQEVAQKALIVKSE